MWGEFHKRFSSHFEYKFKVTGLGGNMMIPGIGIVDGDASSPARKFGPGDFGIFDNNSKDQQSASVANTMQTNMWVHKVLLDNVKNTL